MQLKLILCQMIGEVGIWRGGGEEGDLLCPFLR